MQKRNIVFLINGFGEGGAQRQCIHLLNSLQQCKNLNITLVYFYEGIYFEKLNTENVNLIKINANSFYDFRIIFRINTKLKTIDGRFILFTWLRSSDFYGFFVSRLNKKCRWIAAERNSNYPNHILFYIRNYLNKYSYCIIANSNKGQQYWVNKGYCPAKIKVIKNILQPDFDVVKHKIGSIRKKLGITTDKKIILYAGRFEPQKNIELIIRLFKRLYLEDCSYLLLMIGSGSLHDEIQKFKEENNIPIVIFPFQKDIFSYYLDADVFLNLSSYEGSPNTVIENAFLKKFQIVSGIDEHIEILGKDYPFYLNLDVSFEDLYSDFYRVLDEQSCDAHYVHFNRVLRDMNVNNVTKNYIKQFEKVLKLNDYRAN